jgi:hypothetical protein
MKVLSDSVTVEFDGVEYVLSKLSRHVLYCIDDERNPSAKYTQQQVDDSINALDGLGLILIDPQENREYLSETGEAVVNLLRERHE